MKTQEKFRSALLDPNHPAPAELINPDGSQALKRFDVYRNNVTHSLSEALAQAFPVLKKLLGAEFFKAMGLIYVRENPPQSPLMMYFGGNMPDFLSAFSPVAHLPYLPDIARLELALRHSYHAADAQPIEPHALSEIAPEQLPDVTFSFAPSMILVASNHPIHSIWRANIQGGTYGTGPEPTLVTRTQFDPQPHLLTPDQAHVLANLASGARLGEALALVNEGFDLSALLGLLLQNQTITKLSVERNAP